MKTKKQFRYFTIVDHEDEQKYLRSMNKSGWKFVKISGFCIYHFEECVPEDVIYQLDYNQDGLAHKEEYIQMFADCGWEYLQDYVGYSYFRKPAYETNGNEEIFCDDDSRLQMMKRVFRGRMIPLVALFSIVLVPQLIWNLIAQNYEISTMCLAVIILYVWLFIKFAIKYNKYRKKAKE